MAEGKIKLITDVIGEASGTGLYDSETISLKVLFVYILLQDCHILKVFSSCKNLREIQGNFDFF